MSTLLKGQLLHLGLLGVAGVLALGVWTRDDDGKLATKTNEVEVWGGTPDSVTVAASKPAPSSATVTVTESVP